MVPYGPALCEHCILLAGLRPTRKPKAEPLGEAERAALLAGVHQWEAWLDACETSAPEGFISFKRAGAVRPGQVSFSHLYPILSAILNWLQQ